MIKTLYNIGLHLLLVGAIIFGVNQCDRANKTDTELSNKSEIFNKANEIVDITLNSDSSKITKSRPHEEVLSNVAINTKNLLDSVSGSLKLPSNEKIVKYNRVPIESSISLKAKEVNSEYAYAENENWYSRYNFRDSIFDLKYKTVYESVITEKENKILGITYKPVTTMQHDWIKDKQAPALKPTSVIIKDDTKTKTKFNVHNTNKFRSFDNSILSGAEAELGINKITISGAYLYNFNTSKPEYEVSLKYKLF